MDKRNGWVDAFFCLLSELKEASWESTEAAAAAGGEPYFRSIAFPKDELLLATTAEGMTTVTTTTATAVLERVAPAGLLLVVIGVVTVIETRFEFGV